MDPSRSYLFVSNFLKLLLIYGVGLLTSLIARLVFMLSYGNIHELQQSSGDVARAFFIGFRTDTMSISYGLLPAFLVILAINFVPKKSLQSYAQSARRFLLTYSTTLFGLFLFVNIIDFFFYRFFNDHLNVLIFALIEDDTQAVLTSMWTDYPVIRIFVVVISGVLAFVFVIRKILNLKIRPFTLSITQGIVAVMLSLILVVTGMRTSWGSEPLRIQNTIVSDNIFINKIGIGGMYSLQNAFKEKADQSINTDIKATLKKYHFRSVDEVLAAHLNKPATSGGDFSMLLERTATQKNLEDHPPHVVVIQMESLSNHLLDFHSQDFNLLGELEGPLQNSYIFRNFVSASSNTINSLEALLIASPETPISQSTFREHSLSSSAALPYQRAGYNTSFLTGGKLGWHNLEGYLPKQYFKEVEGNVALNKNNPLATEGEWGTYDEFLFDRIYQKLENSTTPQFIYAMTTSNHTPFDLPETYKPYPITIPASVDSLLKVDKTIALRNFKTYQYANDCLGKFIDRINASPLKENTIIVAVGDHSIAQLLYTSDHLLLKKLSVPLIIIIPQRYRPTHEIDQSRFGSHKDVFPTLYHISLSNAEYLKSGNNLCSPPSDSTYFFGVYKYNTGFSKDGCVLVNDNLVFHWTDSLYTTLAPGVKSDQSEYLRLKTRAYSAAMSCFIKNELSQ